MLILQLADWSLRNQNQLIRGGNGAIVDSFGNILVAMYRIGYPCSSTTHLCLALTEGVGILSLVLLSPS